MSDFHFLRPWWLIAIVPTLLIGWRLWAFGDPARRWRGIVDPELLPHLLVGGTRSTWSSPTAWLVIGWTAAAIALSGPTWRREPSPFADDTAALVIVLKVTPSMLTEDIQPARLTRAVEKIHDLSQLRAGAQTALVAYSGSAHQVMPLTTDGAIIDTFAAELAPDLMPTEGDDAAAALELANQLIAKSQQRGWILWIADAASPDQISKLQVFRKQSSIPVTILAVATDGPERQTLTSAGAVLDSSIVDVTPDDADVHQLAANTRFSRAADGTEERWRDDGYLLVPLLAGICLAWFSRGWVAGGLA